MTLRLILIRHAKSAWDDPLQDDHDRKLNARGRDAAPKIGAWLAGQGYFPAEVLSSTARRTLETWDCMAPALGEATVMRRDPGLYHASAERMLEALNGCAASPVLMLGHNPGIGEFAARLLRKPPQSARFDRYPTCATLVADFEAEDWSAVSFGTGTAVTFITPKDLEG
ncbi:SixA phosphatase family protein [Rhodovulum adriaticum]|uniref:Phosphohistidine phosphatase n=1 Tax=Rhodovulum adriaticum TaxID=35804 RepID=A0A4R2NGY0_RHOAD|nr:histidine phosphatase family protein [Rhodovulum adriaticum]MBK1636805.1 phosphoglycerate mutase [Rhodovulum adriaticum]TCP20679.1 phosphohistidine phosphatase [Rhodovulum adriaticum]